MAKKYNAVTGVDEFYYGVLNADESGIDGAAPERIKFLQNISVEAPQEIARAYGDNVVAELATSNQPVTVSSQFHKLPAEDLNTLLGLESTEAGLSAYGGTDNPPYVACVCAKTHGDGSKERCGIHKAQSPVFLHTAAQITRHTWLAYLPRLMKMALKSGLDSQKVSLCNHLRNPIPKRILLNLVMIRAKRELSTGRGADSETGQLAVGEGSDRR